MPTATATAKSPTRKASTLPVLDLTFYNIILSQLDDAPNLSAVQQRTPLPEHAPVVLKEVVRRRGHLEHFVITNGTHDVVCTTTVPDLQKRIMGLELGTIFHLIGAEVTYSEPHHAFILVIDNVCTLKEYDTRLKQEQAEKARRQAWLKAQGYLDDTPAYTAVDSTAFLPQSLATAKPTK